MRKMIKRISKKTDLGHNVLFQMSLSTYYVLRNKFISDEKMIKKKFKRSFGVEPNLINPKTYNEKIQWLKLNDRSPLHTQCADKYKVRDYIEEKIGSSYLVPLVFQTKDPSEINDKTLPDFPVIVKTNHDSSNVFIIEDKNGYDWDNLQKVLSRELRKNYYYASQEWQYKNIEKRIIVEKLLKGKEGKLPADCKIHCFNGRVKLISMDVDRGLPTHSRSFYDRNWNKVDLHLSSTNARGENKVNLGDSTEIPKGINKIIDLSEKLSAEFLYVRVDWLYIDNQFFNGEMTFHSDNGLSPIKPEPWDRKMGDFMDLPLQKSN